MSHLKYTGVVVYVCLCCAAAVDGGWSRWSPWSRCNKRCGGGRSIRTRSCSSPPPKNGGKKCVGEKNQVKPCNTKPCGELDIWIYSHMLAGFSIFSKACRDECLLIQCIHFLFIFFLCKALFIKVNAAGDRHSCRGAGCEENARSIMGKILDLMFVHCQMREDARWARSTCRAPTSVHSGVQTSSRASSARTTQNVSRAVAAPKALKLLCFY